MEQLKWMGDHRILIQKVFCLFNTYARQYNSAYLCEGTHVLLSSAQIQVMEHVMEADGNEKMSDIAANIGITKGTFSNNVKKLVERGYLEKRYCNGNQKDIFLRVTPAGNEIYREYSDFIYQYCFKDIFELVDVFSAEEKKTLEALLDRFTDAFNAGGKIPEKASEKQK